MLTAWSNDCSLLVNEKEKLLETVVEPVRGVGLMVQYVKANILLDVVV